MTLVFSQLLKMSLAILYAFLCFFVITIDIVYINALIQSHQMGTNKKYFIGNSLLNSVINKLPLSFIFLPVISVGLVRQKVV